MRTDTARIDVALGFDLTYAPHAAAVLASVVRSSPAAQFRFIILHDGVEADLQAELEALAPRATFVWASVGTEIPEFLGHGHFSRATLFRLGLETLAPADCSRLIYLDTDIVVLGDLSELWQADLRGYSLGAVFDENEDGEAFATRWMRPTSDYFNAGVLVIDLDQVRSERLFSAAAAFYARHAPALSWADQDALNYVCAGRWQALDPRWNVQRSTAIAETRHGRNASARPAPLIVHFTGSQKPWQPAAYHPWSWLYWQALAGTPFYDQIRRRGGVSWTALQRMRLRLWRRASGTLRRLDLLAGDGGLDVSLVIATRNRARQLSACLEAIGRLEFEGSFEVIVVDNGSTDDTATVIASAGAPRARLIATSGGPASAAAGRGFEIPDPVAPAGCRRAASVRRVYHARPGLGGARNAGLAIAKGRIIAFTDDDCYVAPDFLTEVVRAFADPRLGCVSGRVELFDPADAPITINRSRTPRRYPAGAGTYLHCDGIIGGNLAFRRTALRAIGGFDASMGAGTPFAAEDVDAAARALGEGWDGAYHPSMVVYHHHGRKAADIPKLYKSYDIGRGAYTVKYLLRGEFLAFAKGVASVRWRIGPPWRWRRSSFTTPAWELYGAVRYIYAHLVFLARRKFGAGFAVN